MKEEIMYNQNSILIVALLFIAILIAYEIFYRIGELYQNKADHEVKSQASAIQTGILGLLALLLGFTFNMALQRFDNRSHAVIQEANAIGTALLRTNLLPKLYESTIYSLLQKYIDLRVETSSVDLTSKTQRQSINDKTDEILNQIWDQAIKASEIDPRPVTTGYFITSLNDLIDAKGERNALLQRHVPEVIIFLLFIIFIIGGALMGYTSGLSQKRAYISTVIFSLLLVSCQG